MTPLTQTRYLPFTNWLFHYRREHLTGDIIAGLIVAVMLVPQSMAYAQLANLPPQIGLYAAIAPILVYGLLGTSGALSVGPVAIDSLMTGAAIAAYAPDATIPQMLALAVQLALMIGVIQLLLGVFRAGFLVNFMSLPVLSGFLNAASIVIAVSQLRHLLGLTMPRLDYPHETLAYIATHLHQINPTTAALSALSLTILVIFKNHLGKWLQTWKVPATLILIITRSAPIIVVLIGMGLVSLFDWHLSANVAIVGQVPAGLPSIGLPDFDPALWVDLFPVALAIALVSYVESISTAKSLASKRRQTVDPNQELIAVGAANLSASFTGAYSVAGGLSRSLVNYTAGANTGLSSIITAMLIAITVVFLTPTFYFMPQAALAATIIIAVAGMLDFTPLIRAWRYNRADAITFVVTFSAVLFIGTENGILLGILTSLALFLWRTGQPHIAIVGQVGQTEHYRNILRHEVTTYPHILAIRVDESLYFPNAQYLENYVLNGIAENPAVKHVILIGSAINYIDTSALESLERLHDQLTTARVELHLAEIKGPVMDRLQRIGFIKRIGQHRVHLSTHLAMQALLK